MKATDFEDRHPVLIRRLIIVAAFLTYLIDPDDIVWRFIKDNATHRELLERSLFVIATILTGVAAGMCTWAHSRPQTLAKGVSDSSASHRRRHLQYIGDLLYAIGLGSLAPLWGFVILGAGEAIRIFRLARRKNEASSARDRLGISGATWREAFRQESFKWGIFLTMVAFTITLRDRVAEVLIGVVCLFALLLTLPFVGRSERSADF
jgi:hypothetical protein